MTPNMCEFYSLLAQTKQVWPGVLPMSTIISVFDIIFTFLNYMRRMHFFRRIPRLIFIFIEKSLFFRAHVRESFLLKLAKPIVRPPPPPFPLIRSDYD